VRRLPAVESLGSATVICVDKTGTLTAGVQTVTTLWLPPREIRVTGTAYEPAGEFLEGDTPLVAADDPALALALRTGALANRAGIEHEGGVWSARGDPTDVALLVAARKAGLDRAALLAHLPEVGEHPFSSERMLMATFHATGDGTILAHVKGAPTALYALCNRVLADGREEPASAEWERRVADQSAALGARGLRVLGLAAGSAGSPSLDSLSGLTFIGLVGMTDPPAPGVRETIARLRGAGIRTVMLTGDQQATAQAVAAELGVTDVVSRITPEGKLRVVTELRDAGHIVAMLGDGVNDAPALRRADIGVAMGTRGTDVAKEAAGIILRDDRLETVVAAVEEGRVVYDNIRRFVFYLFSCNLAEIIALLGAGALGLPLPMTPLQILYLNLVTDTMPALALALEPAGRHIMTRPPRDPRAAILSPGLLRLTALYAVLIAAITLIALAWGLRTGPHEPMRAVTLSFTTLALAQLFHLGNARSEEHVLTPRRIVANRFAVGAIVLSLAAQAGAVMLPGLSRVLGTEWLSARDWLVALVLSLVPAVVGQAWKAMVPPRTQTVGGPPQNRTRDPSRTRSPG
jgi:Ca2+-transporting ATPase